jgi:hypothetical protein
MKTIQKLLLTSVVALFAFAPANAGDLSVSGSMEISNTTGLSGGNTGGTLGQENEMSLKASTELDNGVSVAYKMSTTGDLARNDSEVVFGNLPMVGGSLAMTSTGTPVDAIDNVVPTAFEEANHGATTWTGVGATDGTFGLRYKLADVLGSGWALDYMYIPQYGAGDAATDEGGSGTSSRYYAETQEIAVKGNPLALVGIEGITVDLGYGLTDAINADKGDLIEGSAALRYAIGPLSLGVQKTIRDYDIKDKSDGVQTDWIRNTMFGAAYAVNDNLSISYQNAKSIKHTRSASSGVDVSFGTSVEQDSTGYSVAYTVGGMKLAYVDNSHDNESYSTVSKDYKQLVLGIAF